MTIEAKRAARRAAMPTITALVKQFEAFAPTVVYAQENGVTVGKLPQYVEVFDIPVGYAPMREFDAKGRK